MEKNISYIYLFKKFVKMQIKQGTFRKPEMSLNSGNFQNPNDSFFHEKVQYVQNRFRQRYNNMAIAMPPSPNTGGFICCFQFLCLRLILHSSFVKSNRSKPPPIL